MEDKIDQLKAQAKEDFKALASIKPTKMKKDSLEDRMKE